MVLGLKMLFFDLVWIRRGGETGLIGGSTAVGGGEGGSNWTCVGNIADAGDGSWMTDRVGIGELVFGKEICSISGK